MRTANVSSGKLRIAMLGHKRIPSREGGVEVVVENLAVRMAELGHEVTVYNRSGHHVSGQKYDLRRTDSWKGVKIKWVPTLDYKGLAAMISSFFGAIACAFGKYDVVHFHAEGPCSMIWIPKLCRKRCIVTVHGLDHQRSKWGTFARRYILFGEKCAVKYADEIIVLNRSAQVYFKEKYGRDTQLIPNGVTTASPRMSDLITREFGLEKDTYILYLGRITPEKGIHYLIEAYKRLNTNKRLVIAGGASDSDGYFAELKTMANGNSSIIFTGFVQGQMLEELYSNAYLYVLPSDLEGMPLSLLEAMSYGNCCVVSDIPECAEVVADKGIVFPKGEISQLQNVLQRLLGNAAQIEKYKKEAVSFICGMYNWDEIVQQTVALYQEVK